MRLLPCVKVLFSDYFSCCLNQVKCASDRTSNELAVLNCTMTKVKSSNCGKNIRATPDCLSDALFFFIQPHLDVNCDLLLNSCTVTWNLFDKRYQRHYRSGDKMK